MTTMLGRMALWAAAVFAATTAWAGPPDAAMLANACTGCHGALGASAGPTLPSLAGQPKAALVDAMREFKGIEKKDGNGKPVLTAEGKPVIETRSATVMGRLAKAYSEAEIDAIAEFFSQRGLPHAEQTIDRGRVARGARLHEAACAHCHIKDGRQGKGHAPALAGQWLPYLRMQMALYLAGTRKMPEKMEEKVRRLSPDDLDALLSFYASVK